MKILKITLIFSIFCLCLQHETLAMYDQEDDETLSINPPRQHIEENTEKHTNASGKSRCGKWIYTCSNLIDCCSCDNDCLKENIVHIICLPFTIPVALLCYLPYYLCGCDEDDSCCQEMLHHHEKEEREAMFRESLNRQAANIKRLAREADDIKNPEAAKERHRIEYNNEIQSRKDTAAYWEKREKEEAKEKERKSERERHDKHIRCPSICRFDNGFDARLCTHGASYRD